MKRLKPRTCSPEGWDAEERKELLLIARSERIEDGASVYERVASEHLMQRLDQARGLLRRDLRRNMPRIRDLLAEAADQADALDAIQPEDSDGEVNAPHIATAVPARVGGEPVGEFLLIPFGEIEVERPLSGTDFAFTPQHAESAVRWFGQLGRKLAIDYEHQSFDHHNVRPDGLRPAAGWIGGLEVRDDGLWATSVNWTERAKELLSAGEYRYFSPVIFWADEDHTDIAGLGPVALTNDPAMHGVTPLAAARHRAGGELPAAAAASVDGTEPNEEAGGAAWDSRNLLQEAEERIAVLSRQVQAMEADSFIERGMRAGKILDSTSLDWREDYLRDANAAESRLARSPVLRPPGRLMQPGVLVSKSPVLANPAQYRNWNVDADDLQAFDKAVAAGRVRLGAR